MLIQALIHTALCVDFFLVCQKHVQAYTQAYPTRGYAYSNGFGVQSLRNGSAVGKLLQNTPQSYSCSSIDV